MRFTAAAVQIAPRKGDVEANLAQMSAAIHRCAAEGADLIVFPEASLTGYFLEGGVAEVAVTAEEIAGRLRDVVRSTPKPVDVIFGFYERGDGHIHNSAIHVTLADGRADVIHVYRKFFLPTYGVFDEERFVARGRDLTAYETRFGKMGMLICEDVWHSIAPTIVALKGAQIVTVISASPARGFSGETFSNLDHYHRLLTAISEEHAVWTINSMLVGFEGGKGFSGGSVIVDPSGKVVAQGNELEEEIVFAEIDTDEVARVRANSPLLSDLTSALEDISREISDVNEQLQR